MYGFISWPSKIDVNLHYLGFVTDFFHMTPKAKTAREKKRSMGHHQNVKPVCLNKGHHQGSKKTTDRMEENFANQISDK